MCTCMCIGCFCHFMGLYVAGTMHSVLIKGGVLISGIIYTLLYVAGAVHIILSWCPHFRDGFVLFSA